MAGGGRPLPADDRTAVHHARQLPADAAGVRHRSRNSAATCRASSPDTRSGASCSPNPGPGSDLAGVRDPRHCGRRRLARQRPEGLDHARPSRRLRHPARPAPTPTADKHDGLSMFIVDLRAPGVEIRPIRQLDGAMHFDEVFLTDVFVPFDAVLPPSGAGWRIASAMLHHQRVARATGQRGGVRHDRTTPSLDEFRRRHLRRSGAARRPRTPVHRRGLPEPARHQIRCRPPPRPPTPARSDRWAS